MPKPSLPLSLAAVTIAFGSWVGVRPAFAAPTSRPALGDAVPLGDSGLEVREPEGWKATPHPTKDEDYCFIADRGTTGIMFVRALPADVKPSVDLAEKEAAADRAKNGAGTPDGRVKTVEPATVDKDARFLGKWHTRFEMMGNPHTETHWYREVGGRVVEVKYDVMQQPGVRVPPGQMKVAEQVALSAAPAGKSVKDAGDDAAAPTTAPAGEADEKVADVPLTVYEPADKSFKLSYPTGWRKMTSPSQPTQTAFGTAHEAADGRPAALEVVMVGNPIPAKPGDTLPEMAKKVADVVKRGGIGFSVVSDGPAKLGDLPAEEMVIDLSRPGHGPDRMVFVVALHNNESRSLAFITSKDHYEEDKPVFNEIAHAFVLP